MDQLAYAATTAKPHTWPIFTNVWRAITNVDRSNGGHDGGNSSISIAHTARTAIATAIATVACIIFFVSLIGISPPIRTRDGGEGILPPSMRCWPGSLLAMIKRYANAHRIIIDLPQASF